MPNKPTLAEAVKEAVWQLGIAAAATGSNAVLKSAGALKAAYEARKVVRADCLDCGWDSDMHAPPLTRETAQNEHDADTETQELGCRAPVRALYAD